MRTATVALTLSAIVICLPADADDDSQKLLRASPRVLLDPETYYSRLLFTKKSPPGPGEWMAEHPEPRQSFSQYAASHPRRPTRGRHTIVISAVGPMSQVQRSRFETLRAFMEIYYTMPVRLGKSLGLDGVTGRDRNLFGRTVRQYLTGDILYRILRPALPEDAYCLLGVTMEDLYPEPSWNYVFGQATLSHRVGVYSLVRFYPEFWGDADSEARQRKGWLRSCHTLIHETGHMFGVHHCQQYDCVMNGTNSLAESDTRPIHLCPVCLRKLRWNIGFDMIARYQGLQTFYETHAMKAEAAWVAKRIRQCRGQKVTPAATNDAAAP